MKFPTFENFASQYLNQVNPAWGKFWIEADIVKATGLPELLVQEWMDIQKSANLRAIMDHGSIATTAEIVAAYQELHPNQEVISVPMVPFYAYKEVVNAGADKPLGELTVSEFTTILVSTISQIMSK
jgi:hypothetical protein